MPNIFGGSTKTQSIIQTRGERGVGFKLLQDGNYDMQQKVLKNAMNGTDENDLITRSFYEENNGKNIELPKRESDATNLLYVRNHLNLKLSNSQDQGINPTMHADIDMSYNKIINVGDPLDDQDIVNKRYLENRILPGNGLYIDTSGYIAVSPIVMLYIRPSLEPVITVNLERNITDFRLVTITIQKSNLHSSVSFSPKYSENDYFRLKIDANVLSINFGKINSISFFNSTTQWSIAYIIGQY